MNIGLPEVLGAIGGSAIVGIIILRFVCALILGYIARRRGYKFWVFVFTGTVFSIIATAIIVLTLPQKPREEGFVHAFCNELTKE